MRGGVAACVELLLHDVFSNDVFLIMPIHVVLLLHCFPAAFFVLL